MNLRRTNPHTSEASVGMRESTRSDRLTRVNAVSGKKEATQFCQIAYVKPARGTVEASKICRLKRTVNRLSKG